MDGHSEGSLTEKQAYLWNEKGYTKRSRCTYVFCTWPAPTVNRDWCDVAQVTIDIIPDVALLDIFDFYVDKEPFRGHGLKHQMEAWHTLVHVCQRWRYIVFGSPRRLNLRLFCDGRTPARKTLNVWPPLPIVVWDDDSMMWLMGRVENIFAALEHNNRVCSVNLSNIPRLPLRKLLAAMQKPFPALTHLHLHFLCDKPVDPASFLGGSVPSLKTLVLDCVPFPGLPKLLLSSPHLVSLTLWRISYSGNISPEAVVTCLSVLIRLKSLEIGFGSPQPYPDKNSLPPQTRTLLPVLTRLCFRGGSEYFEDLVARIDAPLLDFLDTMFFHQLIFDVPQLTQFMSRTPGLKAHDETRLIFSTHWSVSVAVPQIFYGALKLGISCRQSDWQVSSVAQVYGSSFPRALIPAVECLYILEDLYRAQLLEPHWKDDIENGQWLELLHPFTGVRDLYISQELVSHIAPALQELVGEKVVEVLPALETLYWGETLPSGPDQEAIGEFVAARQLANHPISVSLWEGNHYNLRI